MSKRQHSPFAILFLLVLSLGINARAQEVTRQDPKSKPPQAQSAKPASQEKVLPEVAIQESTDEALRRTLTGLAEQIDKLSLELKKMRQESERHSTLLELALLEERLTRIEDKIDNTVMTKANLDAQETDIQRRQRNISQELIFRGGQALRRDETEAALKQEFQRTLDSLHAQQSALQTRLTDLQAQADRLRFRIETLRKKADRLELKTESPNDK
jgi:chromosome segregation ATPase